MDREIRIRGEAKGDERAITRVTVAAFRTLQLRVGVERFDITEHRIILALRSADALVVSLVADMDGSVVGHVAFSRLTISAGTTDWYALGPLSVLPAQHRKGIGTALVREGLSRLKGMNARGCCVVGDPAYYTRFGFESLPELSSPGVPEEVLLATCWTAPAPRGEVTFHEAFEADAAL